MTLETFFELQRVRAASTSDDLSKTLQRKQFDRAGADAHDTTPQPYKSPNTRKIDNADANWMKHRMRYD